MEIDNFQPISEKDKTEQIVEVIRELVLSEKLKPGSELPSERELSAQFNVSRYSLREALRAAQAQGLVELSRGKRPRVTMPSSETAIDILGLAIKRSKATLSDLVIARISLECEIAGIVAEKAENELLEKLEIITKQMEYHKEDIKFCAEKDLEFHNDLVEASGNKVFKIMLTSVAQLLKTSRIATLELTGTDRALEGHVKIIEALKEGDKEKAKTAMLKHLEMAEDDILKLEALE